MAEMTNETVNIEELQPASRSSRESAERLRERFPTLKARVLDFVRERGFDGATREEIAVVMGVKEGTVCGAVDRLQKDGEIHTALFKRRSSLGNEVDVLLAKVEPAGTQAALFSLESSSRRDYH